MRSAAFAATRRPMARGWPCLAIASAARLALARPGLRMAGGGAGGGRCSTMLEGFSIETTPQTSAKVEDHSAILPAGTRVYVAAIPGVALEDVSALCARLKREGLTAVPHVAARSFRDQQTLAAFLAQLQEGGVEDVLLIAGDVSEAGAYPSSIALLETGLIQAHGIRRVDVAGHPEGSPHMNTSAAHQGSDAIAHVVEKAAWAEKEGIALSLVTQVCFDIDKVGEYVRALRASGVAAPVRVGIPGPASLASIVKYAAVCGVGPSLSLLTSNPARVLSLATQAASGAGGVSDPAPLVAALLAQVDKGGLGDVSLHLFSFGGLSRTAEWASRAAREQQQQH